MGDVEDTTLPMLFRESPLNSIWEGSGNVICLDVLRTLAHEPLAGEALNAELDAARGSDERFDMALGEARVRWRKSPEENEARVFVEAMATLLTAAILIRHAPSAIADGYVTSRLMNDRGSTAGTVTGIEAKAILERCQAIDA